MHPRIIFLIFAVLHIAGMSSHATSYTPFMLSIGLTFEDIARVNAWFVLSMLLAEIPTARLADGRGRGFSLRCGALLAFLGILSYAFTQTYAQVLVAEIILGIAFAFFSGATNAWIADALKRRGEFHTLHDVQATTVKWKSMSALLAAMIGAGLAHAFGLRIPFFLDAILLLGLILFTFKFVGKEGDTDEEDKLNFKEAVKTIWNLLRNDTSLIWIIAVSMVGSIAVIFNHLWSPFFLQWMSQAWLGAIFAVIQISLFAGGWFLRRFNMEGKREVLFASVASSLTGLGLMILGLAIHLPLALIFLVVHEVGRVVDQAVVDPFIQHRIKSSVRATFSSAVSVMTWVGKGASLYILSLFLRTLPETMETIRISWIWGGSVMIALSLLLFLFRPTRPSKL